MKCDFMIFICPMKIKLLVAPYENLKIHRLGMFFHSVFMAMYSGSEKLLELLA